MIEREKRENGEGGKIMRAEPRYSLVGRGKERRREGEKEGWREGGEGKIFQYFQVDANEGKNKRRRIL